MSAPTCAICWIDPETGRRGTNATPRLCRRCKKDPANRDWVEAPEDRACSPYLTTEEAARYLRYGSASAVRALVFRGDLRPAGAGPRRTMLFRVRSSIDSLNSEGASSYHACGQGNALRSN